MVMRRRFSHLRELEQAIVDYIDYYNNKRIKVKLKGLSPVQYRTKSFVGLSQPLFVIDIAILEKLSFFGFG